MIWAPSVQAWLINVLNLDFASVEVQWAIGSLCGDGFFFGDRDNLRDRFYDGLISRCYFQVIIRLQAHPHFWRAAKEPRDPETHDRGERAALGEYFVKHLAGNS
jgi:hypothetical protein